MDERSIAAAALALAATVPTVIGAQMRAGRWLEVIQGIDLAKVRDRDQLGQFAGLMLMILAAVLLLMASALAMLPESELQPVLAVGATAIFALTLRLAFGVRPFQRR